METRSKTAAENFRPEVTEPAFKKQRLGVGSAVAKFVPGPADDFLLVLAKTKAERLIPTIGKIIVTTRQETLPVVLRSMIDNNILSCVVLTKSGKYHGFIEIFDILKYVVELYGDLPEDQIPSASLVQEKQSFFENAVVMNVISSPRTSVNPYHPCHIGYSLFHIWEVLACSGGHRVPVLDNNFTIWDIITQSMLVDFLWQNLEKIGTLATRTVGTMFAHLPLVVEKVTENTTAIVAFTSMIQKQVRGLAVVDQNGKLVDSLSDRDLRVVYPTKSLSDFNVLWTKTVGEVKEILRARSPQTPPKLFFVTPESTFASLLEIMATHHIHRIFMVDNKTHVPIRCISQTDVLGVILSEKI